jgi:GNAT superfamily N-acetyltransferase
MTDIIIREATPDDIPQILNIYSSAGVGEVHFSVEEATVHYGRLKQYPSFHLYIAFIDQNAAGTYELLIMDNMAKRGRRSGIVEDVAVDPRYQGRGVGRAMLRHAREQCRDANCYKLLLSSNLKREGAHRFYESIGFERHGYSFQTFP